MRRMLSMMIPLALAACYPPPPGGQTQDTDDTADGLAEPIETANGWWFQPLDGMHCGGGHGTGIGVEPGSDPTKLAVWVAGGGACWDGNTCFILNSAVNLETAWGAAQLEAEAPTLNRAADATVLSDATFAYVPYCTGDLHAGRSINSYDPLRPDRLTHHVGDANIQAVVAYLAEAYPDVEELWLVGVSAGGYGAQLQADRFAAAWPEATLRLLADGSPMVTPYGGRYGEWRTAWDLRFPDGCTDCATSLTAALETQVAALPDATFGLTTYTDDAVITLYMNYPAGGLAPAQAGQLQALYAESDQLAAFVKTGTDHTMIGTPAVAADDGTILSDWWLAFLVAPPLDDAGW